MSEERNAVPEQTLICAKCNTEMKQGKVKASYMGSEFPIELLKCPVCGMVFVPESLAIGKMLQVEQALEDK
jgi:uncharacterized OB-fold protein